jgi:hypothetical protein
MNRTSNPRKMNRGRRERSKSIESSLKHRGFRARGEDASPATTMDLDLEEQEEEARELRAERQRASARMRMGERGGGGEDITRKNGTKGAAVTLASHARIVFSHLHPESQFFWPPRARSRPARARLPRNEIHFHFLGARLGERFARRGPGPIPHPGIKRMKTAGRGRYKESNAPHIVCPGEPIFLAAARSLTSRASQATKKWNPFSFPGSQAQGSVLHAEGQAPYPIQASKRMKTAPRGPGRERYKESNAPHIVCPAVWWQQQYTT